MFIYMFDTPTIPLPYTRLRRIITSGKRSKGLLLRGERTVLDVLDGIRLFEMMAFIFFLRHV